MIKVITETDSHFVQKDSIKECVNCGRNYSPNNKEDEVCSEYCVESLYGAVTSSGSYDFL